jgi:anthranilate synthase component 2
MILLIDNYDSFSYNLYQLLGAVSLDLWSEADIRVVRNDELTVAEIAALAPSHLVISPGPGKPSEAGVIEQACLELSGKTNILGVCLGHQALCEAFGATVSYAKKLMHGKQAEVTLDAACPLFVGLPETIPAARYHSLAALADTLPADLQVVARADDDEVMAVQHRRWRSYGIQFHPESIMTPNGRTIIKNYLSLPTY